MDLRADILQGSTKEGFLDSLAQGIRQEAGSMLGHKVVVRDALTAAAENAEEVGFQNVEKLEQTLKKRGEGKERGKMVAAQLAAQFVNRMYDTEASRKLPEFLSALKREGFESEQEIREFVREWFADVSDQYAALEYASLALDAEGGNETLLAAVEKAKKSLLEESGPAIRAGINILKDVLEFSRGGIARPDALRDLYRESVLGRSTVAETYQNLLKRYGPTQFDQAVSFLIQAAGNDLASRDLGSSMDRVQLESAVNDISHVQYIGHLHSNLDQLLFQVRTGHAAA